MKLAGGFHCRILYNKNNFEFCKKHGLVDKLKLAWNVPQMERNVFLFSYGIWTPP